MSKTRPLADEDGLDIPMIDPTTEIGQAVALLEWARRRGFIIAGELVIGSTRIPVQDPRVLAREARGDGERRDDGDIWREAGHKD